MHKSKPLQTLTEGIEAMAGQYIDAVGDKDKRQLCLTEAYIIAQCNMDSLKTSVFAYEQHSRDQDLTAIKVKLQDLIAFLIIIKASVDKL
jgi:hypothetical protein